MEKKGKVSLSISRQAMSAVVQDYLNHRKVSARSKINDRLVISRLFSWLTQNQRITHWNANPASSLFLKLDKAIDGPKHTATQQHIDSLLEVATGEFRAVVVLILVALRPAGALRCKWTDMDLRTRTLQTTEKKRTRTVKLSPWACEELGKLKKAAGPVWTNSYGMFFYTFKITARRLNLKSILTAYALRRAVVARLWSSGYTAEQAAKALGHSVAVAQRHYRALEAAKDVSDSLDWGPKTQK